MTKHKEKKCKCKWPNGAILKGITERGGWLCSKCGEEIKELRLIMLVIIYQRLKQIIGVKIMGKESKERVCTITINVEGEPAEYLTHVVNSGLHTVEEVDKKTENQ